MKRILILALGLIIIGTASAQDPRFSQFYASPLTLNPAMTGLFKGNYRFTGIYRNQDLSVTGSGDDSPFSTISAGVDFRFDKGFDKGDAIGVGLNVLSDRAGALRLGFNQIAVSFAYLKALNTYKNNYIVLGFQAEGTQLSVDMARARFGSQFDETDGSFDPSQPGVSTPVRQGLNERDQYYDAHVGALWFIKPKARVDAFVGVSAYHLLTPNASYINEETEIDMRFTGHAGVHFPIRGRVDLLPRILTMYQGNFLEVNMGTDIKLFFNERDPMGSAFYFGIYNRLVNGNTEADQGPISYESLIFTTKIDYQGLGFGIAYDVNLSEKRNASLSRGAFEVFASYTGVFRGKRKRPLECPAF